MKWVLALLILTSCSQVKHEHISPKFHYNQKVSFIGKNGFYGKCVGLIKGVFVEGNIYFYDIMKCNCEFVGPMYYMFESEENITLIGDSK